VRREDVIWPLGRYTLGALAGFHAGLRVRHKERIPKQGGLVVALNHFHWIDIPLFAIANPRDTFFVAKVEAHMAPGLGQFIRGFGSFAIRRGESDRDAVRRMREVVREGDVLGVFAEGTRQRSGVPGEVQPGAAMVAIQESVPLVCGVIDGTQSWTLTRPFKGATILWGEPMSLDGLPRGAKGYREGSQLIQAEIRRLWESLRV